MRTSRSEQLMVRLLPGIKEEFQEICNQKGISMSTMAAVIIGEYVQRNDVKEDR